MLPGFRFLIAAIVLSMSVLIFGLGATALLRAAHQEFASTPSWQPAPETRFAQQEPPEPVLAMLRVEPVADDSRAPDQAAAVVAETDLVVAASPAIAAPSAVPEKMAALKPEDPSPSGSTQTADRPAPSSETASTPVIPGADPSTVVAASAPADVIRTASPGETVTNADASAGASGTVSAGLDTNSGPPQAAVAPQQVAALGNSSIVTDAKPQAKVAIAKPDKSALRKRLQALRAIQRRRIAARARLAAAKQALTPSDPFAASAPVTPVR